MPLGGFIISTSLVSVSTQGFALHQVSKPWGQGGGTQGQWEIWHNKKADKAVQSSPHARCRAMVRRWQEATTSSSAWLPGCRSA